jgi:hypothetical protein
MIDSSLELQKFKNSLESLWGVQGWMGCLMCERAFFVGVVSMRTVARPFSVRKMVMLGIFLRSVMAWASSGVMLEGEAFGWERQLQLQHLI